MKRLAAELIFSLCFNGTINAMVRSSPEFMDILTSWQAKAKTAPHVNGGGSGNGGGGGNGSGGAHCLEREIEGILRLLKSADRTVRKASCLCHFS